MPASELLNEAIAVSLFAHLPTPALLETRGLAYKACTLMTACFKFKIQIQFISSWCNITYLLLQMKTTNMVNIGLLSAISTFPISNWVFKFCILIIWHLNPKLPSAESLLPLHTWIADSFLDQAHTLAGDDKWLICQPHYST